MSTILFDKHVFGPIHSRRLGRSLGINLLPYDGKVCNFDCIYCECGYNKDFKTKTELPSKEIVLTALEIKLKNLNAAREEIDVITFSGNGEPTLHPQFEEIIDGTIILSDKLVPQVKISVLTNAMQLSNDKIFASLKKIDNNILKLDSAFIDTVKLIDNPNSSTYSIEKQVELFKKFDGDFILQTMFLKGEHEGIKVDNTTDKEINAWLGIVKETKPRQVMIYTLDRETPSKKIEKVSLEKLTEIGNLVHNLGIDTIIAG